MTNTADSFTIKSGEIPDQDYRTVLVRWNAEGRLDDDWLQLRLVDFNVWLNEPEDELPVFCITAYQCRKQTDGLIYTDTSTILGRAEFPMNAEDRRIWEEAR